MDDTYRRLWVLLRGRLSDLEGNGGYGSETDGIRKALRVMAEMEANEYLEN